MNSEIQVTEQMAAFIQWANEKGEDETRRIIRDRLLMLKEECEKTGGHVDSDGFKWDDALEPNEDVDQWKHGGDCNLCRKINYCNTRCRANKLLRSITTPFLYQCYIEEHPEVAAKEAGKSVTPEDVIKQLGVQ